MSLKLFESVEKWQEERIARKNSNIFSAIKSTFILTISFTGKFVHIFTNFYPNLSSTRNNSNTVCNSTETSRKASYTK